MTPETPATPPTPGAEALRAARLALVQAAGGVTARPGLPPAVPAPATCLEARVLGRSSRGLRVLLAGRRCAARRAASCLLDPAPGDTVALLRTDTALYVVAVLERGAAEAELRLPERVTVRAGERLTFAAPELELRGERLRLLHGTLETLGRCWEATLQSWRVVGERWSSVFAQVDQHAGRQQRTVQGLEQVRVGALDCEAQQLMRLHAENLLANGEQLVKVRASQVHLG